jgi:hypothetical protein
MTEAEHASAQKTRLDLEAVLRRNNELHENEIAGARSETARLKRALNSALRLLVDLGVADVFK